MITISLLDAVSNGGWARKLLFSEVSWCEFHSPSEFLDLGNNGVNQNLISEFVQQSIAFLIQE